jgi:hypothetical protein
MSTSSENAFNIGMRRASTFSILHEASMLKETGHISLPEEGKEKKGKGKWKTRLDDTARRITIVRENALSDLERLKNLPASSYKWTWGEKLTEEEVLNVRRSGTNPGRVPHSAYDISLEEGKLNGVYSDGPSGHNSFTGKYDSLPEMFIPPTDLYFPDYFSNPEYRLVSNPIFHPVPVQAPAPSELADEIDKIADAWASNASVNDSVASSGMNMAEEILQLPGVCDSAGHTSSSGHTSDMGDKTAPVPVGDVNAEDILNMAVSWDNNQAPAFEEDTDSEERSGQTSSSGQTSDVGDKTAPVPVSDDADDIENMAVAWVQALALEKDTDSDERSISSDGVPVDPMDVGDDADNILHMADAWEPVLDVNADDDDDDDDEILNMAAGWNVQGEFSEDEYKEHSGDELTNPSYPNMPSAAVAAPVAAEEAPGTTDFNWSQRPFGPSHFSFLKTEMFSDGEEEEDDDEDDS